MAETRSQIRFLLNDETIELTDPPATGMLLDFLRLDKHLRGSKEGCAEGDCGACTVLVGRLRDGALRYQAINACICFAASLDGAHVVTIEHLRQADGSLHPVQQAMVELHGSQCGFCTPGIVMSLYGLWMENPAPTVGDVEVALQGNLCRCTGYAPILAAGMARQEYWPSGDDRLSAERDRVMATLAGWQDGVSAEGEGYFVPATLDALAGVSKAHPEALIVGGATDAGLWVTKQMRDIAPVVFTAQVPELHRIAVDDGGVTFGGGVTYAEALPAIEKHFPALRAFWLRIGGAQVRNAGTLGGNIANGSPIGDTPPPFMVLGATVTLRKGQARRVVRLEDFFIAYGRQDREPGELVESVHLPPVPKGDHFAVYKVSKRRDEDISAVCGAFRVRVADGRVSEVAIAFGGMAAVPKRARAVEKALLGKAWESESIEASAAIFSEDYQPLSDMRASADYRLLVAQNLLRRFYLETIGEGEALSRGAA